jgi:parallel beta-helix repeat protein
LTIDGTTQPGYEASPIVILNGASAGTADGLRLLGDNITVRGLVINGFSGWGIYAQSLGGNIIEGNYVGTDPAGLEARPNNGGIAFSGTSAGVIRNNLVSGNGGDGILLLAGAMNTIVENNRIGTRAAGDAPLGNAGAGVAMTHAETSGNMVLRNTIAANTYQGVDIILGAHHNFVAGNYIGTNSAGGTGLGNQNGVRVEQGGHDITIGGPLAGDRNVISGNQIAGVQIAIGPTDLEFPSTGTSNVVVEGNLIGTDPSGAAALPNEVGVAIAGATNTIVRRNVIAGNPTGISLLNPEEYPTEPQTTGTKIVGNHIGINAAGTARVGVN